MARKTREEKTIEHGEIVIDDLKKLHSENSEAYMEYSKLLGEYKKLSKRFAKTLNISDTVGKGVLDQTEKLQDNLEYTIDKAKKKILYNIEEHRKTKDVLAKVSSNESEIVGRLKRELKDLRQYTIKLEHELNKESSVSHEFQESEQVVKPNDINPKNLYNKSFEKLITQYLERAIFPTSVAKVSIDDFKHHYNQMKNFGSDKVSILKVFYKYFNTTLGAKHIVYYFGNNIFYIILNGQDIKSATNTIETINIPRTVSNISFTFSIGLTELQNEDYNSFLTRIDQANEEALKDNTGCSLVCN